MKIVCLGDSLTYGYEVRRSRVWTTLTAKKSGALVLNRGISGITTTGMLGNFHRDVIAEDADVVLLMGGANDILFNLDAEGAEKNLDIMAQRAMAAGIHTFIGIPSPLCPPIREDWLAMVDFAAALPIYAAYIKRLYAFVREQNYAVVDFCSAILSKAKENNLPLRSLLTDGVHLNEQGHQIFADCFLQTLQEAGLYQE
ncbi:MAG: GDSL-type esterase/lipase family protein [Deltaproteobacteria bacterium]|jgi:lysophospholipase L1-like esterase|nr:GDSL-type esterase/lipase family protein [Deltaproteobacteria bacterium]